MNVLRNRWFRIASAVAVLGFVVLNAMAYFHARAMTRWSESSERTPEPEALGPIGRMRVLLTGVRIPRPVNSGTPADVGLPFRTIRFANGEGEELEAWYIPAAGNDESTPLFILFHGYASAKQTMLSTARDLRQLGHGVLLVDFYGSGGSSGSNTSFGIHEALDVKASVELGRERWPGRPLVLYGHSMGAAAILRAVAHHSVSPDGIVLDAVFDRFLSTVQARFRAMGLPSTPLAQLLTFWGGVAGGIDSFDHNPADDARSVACPTLVFHGSRDARTRSPEARSVHDNLAGWRLYSEYPDAGHGFVQQVDHERWRADLRTLIAQVSPGST